MILGDGHILLLKFEIGWQGDFDLLWEFREAAFLEFERASCFSADYIYLLAIWQSGLCREFKKASNLYLA